MLPPEVIILPHNNSYKSLALTSDLVRALFAPTIWNSFPHNVRFCTTFRKHLKHLISNWHSLPPRNDLIPIASDSTFWFWRFINLLTHIHTYIHTYTYTYLLTYLLNIRINLRPILWQTRVIGLHLRRWWYGSIFVQIFVVSSERRMCFETEHAFQGHPRSYQSKAFTVYLIFITRTCAFLVFNLSILFHSVP